MKNFTAELPGLSVFVKDAENNIFHTYSCYARGLDNLNPSYQLLDLLPKGRDEASLDFKILIELSQTHHPPPQKKIVQNHTNR